MPALFNTDQGNQFNSSKFIRILKEYQIEISMDSRRRWHDKIYTERLGRSLKDEDVYLNDYESVHNVRQGVENYFMPITPSGFISIRIISHQTSSMNHFKVQR